MLNLITYVLPLFSILYSCQIFDQGAVTDESEVVSLIENLYVGTGGLTVGPEGNIYLTDFGPWLSGTPVLNPKNRVYKLSPDGDLSLLAFVFDGASMSKFDQAGNYFQSNVKLGYISKFDQKGIIDTFYIEGQRSPVG